MNNTHPCTARQRARIGAISLVLLLGACALPGPATRPAVYDFGPGALSATSSDSVTPRPALVIEPVEAPAALEGNAVLYRLAYADNQQLQPYALARWSMTPAQLLAQRLREQLGQRYTVLKPGDGGAANALTLRVELEEFSQLFATPTSSIGLLRLRATATPFVAAGGKVAQRSFVVQRSATSADAPGGVRALTQATDAALQELDRWLQELGRP